MSRRYFVVVAELNDLVRRRKRDKPNVFVSVKELDDPVELMNVLRAHPYYGAHIASIRTDLHKQRVFLAKKNAGAAATRLKRRLAREGFTVNPTPGIPLRVYVHELDAQQLGVQHAKAFYVGETAKTVDERQQIHLSGSKQSSVAMEKAFLRRREDLEPKRAFYSRWDSQAEEDALGRKLERQGFHVEGPKMLYRKQKWDSKQAGGQNG